MFYRQVWSTIGVTVANGATCADRGVKTTLSVGCLSKLSPDTNGFYQAAKFPGSESSARVECRHPALTPLTPDVTQFLLLNNIRLKALAQNISSQ